MTKSQRQSDGAKKMPREKGEIPDGKEAEAANPESCRCKEVSKKTPREMLGLMIDDLTFWKKQKGKNPAKHD